MSVPSQWRYAALVALLSLVGAATFFIAFAQPTPPSPAIPTPPPQSPLPSSQPRATAIPLHTYLIDVAGWYEITPNERAVASPIDMTFDGFKALPRNVGQWVGEPYDYGRAVDEWFENPDLALSSAYRDDEGHQVWFSAFGSLGRKSYFLFEHTPITSYPAAGWTLVEHGIVPIPIGDKQILVQKATLTKDAERRVVFYWYLWSDFNRAPDQGVITMRLHVPVTVSDADAFEAGADFLRSLFPQAVAWRRF